MKPQPYRRKAHFYETDKMGIVHHSNHIRWFEEARMDWMEQMGYTFAQMEADGVGSVVLATQCSYKAPVQFNDVVLIHVEITEFTHARMTVSYRVENEATGALCNTGETKLCFVNTAGRPISLKKANPRVYELFQSGMVKPEA